MKNELHCPYCGFEFKVLAINSDEIPDLAPAICEGCGGISLFCGGVFAKATGAEVAAIKTSPAWRDVLEPAQKIILAHLAETKTKRPKGLPQTTLLDGSPVTEDHRDIQPSGMQKSYVVLSEDERRKGFVRPYREAYIHSTCGSETRMGRAIAETYARDPHFYSGTFCVRCKAHFPLDQFVWSGTRLQVGQ
jgi:hypothetical protein